MRAPVPGLVLGLAAAALIAAGSAASAGEITRIGTGGFPIATSVKVPEGSTLVFVSGLTPDVTAKDLPAADPASYGDTKAQTISTLIKIDAALKAQGMTMGDVVNMRVYLVGDPAKGGKMDFAGMMAGYNQYFGTKEQPNLPSRTTMQVVSLPNPAILVEIDVVAARAK